MTKEQSKRFALNLAIRWHKPPVAATVTSSTNEDPALTLEILLDTLRGIQPPRAVTEASETFTLVTPQIAQRLAETEVNPNFYGTLRIEADLAIPDGQAFIFSPNSSDGRAPV